MGRVDRASPRDPPLPHKNATTPPRLVERGSPIHAHEDPDDDLLLFPADPASATEPTPTAPAGDACRTATYIAALAQAKQALNDEHTTLPELTRSLQQQQDLLVELQNSAQRSRSASGFTKKPRQNEKAQPKDRKRPAPELLKEKHDTAELFARLFFKHTASAPLKVPPSAAAVRTRALVTLDVKTPFPSPDRRRQRADLVRQIGNRIQCYHQGWPRIYPRGIECIITTGQSANPRTSRISKSYSAVLVLSIMTHH